MPRSLLLLGMLCLAVSGTAQRGRQSVLIVLPDPPGRPISTLVFEGMQAELRAQDPGIAISTDYISQFGKDRPGYQEAQINWYRTKYSGVNFDAIIVLGPQAMDALLTIRAQLWPNVPLIFAGVDEAVIRRYPPDPKMTGVIVGSAIEGNVRLLRRIFPALKQVAVVGGASPQDRAYNARLLNALAKWAPELHIIELTGLPLDELQARAEDLPPDTALMLDSYLYDPAGRPVFIRDLAASLSRTANAPLVMSAEFGMGAGAIGGMIVHLGTIGSESAKMALRVLRGTPPSQIPLQHITASRLEFDWRQLRKWNVPSDRLPTGSEILFRQVSIWEHYRWWLMGILGAGLLESALIAILLYERRKAARSEQQQKRAEAEALIAREQLSRLNRIASMGELVASLANDLHQPLAGILSNAQTAGKYLKQYPPNLKEVTAALEDIREHDLRAAEVIRKIRHMLKKSDSQSVAVDLNCIASEAVALVRSDARARRITLDLELASVPPAAKGDAITLQQVIVNLVLNAMESMPPAEIVGAFQERRVLVRVEPAGSQDGPLLSVLDTGPGLPSGIKERIFDPFFSTKPDGLGMGLSISRSIVEMHGGRLWAENREEGGATFYVLLRPAALEASAR